MTDEEFAKRDARNLQTRTQELNRVGAFRNDVGTRTVRQTSLVVDPADGKMPPMTPDAQSRGAAVALLRRSAPTSWLDRSFYGTATSDALRLTERFTRAASDTLNYEATIDDPKTYTRPWTVSLPLTTQPGYRVLPYECHEGNFALSDILSAARAEEKATSEALAKGLKPPAPSVWQGNFVPGAPPRGPNADRPSLHTSRLERA